MQCSKRIAIRGLASTACGACLLLAPATGCGRGQGPARTPANTTVTTNTTTSTPASTPGFTFPYKKGDVTIARVSWDEGRAVSLTLYDVKGFRCETFNPDGTPNLLLEAPTCLFNLNTTNASSSGSLTVTQSGDAFSLTGVGFNWNHSSQRLQISNDVHAVFRLKSPGALLPLSP